MIIERLGHLLEIERILFLDCAHKEEALLTLTDNLGNSPEVKNKAELTKAIFHRETLMSTGIGLGLGIPHVRLESVKNLTMSIGVCQHPLLDYDSIDRKPVELIFMIAAGKEQHAEYLKVLAFISSKLKSEELRKKLLSAKNAESFYQLLMKEPCR